jgi:hypothetical protein
MSSIEMPIAYQLPEGGGSGFSEAQLMGVAREAEKSVKIEFTQVAATDGEKAVVMNRVGI